MVSLKYFNVAPKEMQEEQQQLTTMINTLITMFNDKVSTFIKQQKETREAALKARVFDYYMLHLENEEMVVYKKATNPVPDAEDNEQWTPIFTVLNNVLVVTGRYYKNLHWTKAGEALGKTRVLKDGELEEILAIKW